jgi:predicted ATP-grasp superfamily ATP-dependent carboligase
VFPVLAKPPGLFGGNGIQRCEDRRALDVFLAGKPEGEIWVVQELLEGHDVCVNMLCQDGKIIASTVQHAVDQSTRTYWPPSYFEFRSDRAASTLARRMTEKLSWSGIINIDMRSDAKRQTLVALEVNGRYWASLLGSMNAGVNFPLLACEAVSGSIVSNRRPRDSRYFKGARNIARSLIGGGKHGVKPHETDLRYLVGDPVRLAWHLPARIAESIRDRFSRQYVAPARGG